MHTLTVISYNCKHFKDRDPEFDLIYEISKECDILFIQEHCLSELTKMCKLGDSMVITVIWKYVLPGMVVVRSCGN